jgi:hypothetical protein
MRPSLHPMASLGSLATLLIILGVGPAAAAPKAVEAGRTAVAQAISDCRKIADKDARLDCYDKAADAFEQAQAQGQVVVIDRAQAHQIKRQAFGFNMPSLTLFKIGPKEEKLDRIEVKLDRAYRSAEGKWVMVTEDGATWRQIDDTDPYEPPKSGDVMAIRTAMLGSYFCKVGTQEAMRCTRTQ